MRRFVIVFAVAAVAASVVSSGQAVFSGKEARVYAASTSASASHAEVVRGVRFRTAPSTESAVIRMLERGERLEVLGRPNDDWLRVRDSGGTLGYVSAQDRFVRFVLEGESGGAADTASGGWTGEIVRGVSFREGPSTSAPRIRYLQKGETVRILERVNAYWFKVMDKTGRTGYVSSRDAFIRVTGAPDTGGAPALGEVATGPSSGTPATPGGQDRDAMVERLIATGMKYLGTPYEYGSDRDDPSTFDCSDFTRYVFLEALDIRLPGDSRGQAAYVRQLGRVSTDWRSLSRGDLLFFSEYKGSNAEDYAGMDKATETVRHVGIYLGDGKMLNTRSQASGGVRIDNLEGTYWEYRFLFGGPAF
ncbi:MAG: hypothetical protein BLM47_11360 [Candidatus Reconcilbacillus cellulovorans]|uniref:Hydrolase Nlp/P60 n=1 Tax=Candidatus Reconcilbacillus cellulovorans TaxID=1906605 RepID=A0A2A6DY27_9BACL|nr:MAG: hypothetical protein BLM47_11360 [Candidatus Reconcilbacillus cellulovorans]